MYKLVAIDMDGTLLDDSKTIPNENIRAIKEASNKGIKIALATGRPLTGIKNYLNVLGLNSPDNFSIIYNGALIQNNTNKKIISQCLLNYDDLMYFHNLSRKFHIHMNVFTKDSCITSKLGKYTTLEAKWSNIDVKIVDFNNLDKNIEITKVIFADEPELISKIMDNLDDDVYSKYAMARSAPYFLEFFNKEINKGIAVKKYADSLNIHKEEIICIGDAGNDIEMIKFAGLGIAMENAFPEIKNVANYITLSNENAGVAHAIDKNLYFLSFNLLYELSYL